MFIFKIFTMFSQSSIYPKLLKMLPTLIIIAVLGGLAYFGFSYMQGMRATLEATKEQSDLLKSQLTEIKAANQAIAEDMKGVKELSDQFNTQLTTIRSNQNALRNVVTSPTFKASVTTNVPAAQDNLNQSFNKMFTNINGATNVK